MSLPSSNSNGGQSSIRNFFRPKQPSYAPPPGAAAVPAPASIPSRQQQQQQQHGILVKPPPTQPPMTVAPTSNERRLEARPAPPTRTRRLDLHPQATISPVQPDHIPALRRITSLLLPVNYPDSFYARLFDPLSSGAFSRVLLWNDNNADAKSPAATKVIGGLICRPEPSPFRPTSPPPTITTEQISATTSTTPTSQPNVLYIQSLVLLSPYRHLGLAAALLDEVVSLASRSEFACESVYAHVWTENEEGLRWYLARGFTCTEEIRGYYFKLRPGSAWIVQRDILGSSAREANANDHSLSSEQQQRQKREDDIATRLERRSVTTEVANLPPLHTSTPVSTPPVLAATTTTLPPPPPSSINNNSNGTNGRPRTKPTSTGRSFQNSRPEMEWNDLPPEMHASPRNGINGNNSNSLSVPSSGVNSGASSRSSSTAPRKKRDRAYPAAAFGS